MQQIAKKAVSFMLSLVLALGVLAGMPATVSAASATGSLDFATAGDSSGDGWSWVQGSKTLTLNNLNLECDGNGILLPAGSTVVLKGNNTIKAANGDSRLGYGIHALGDLAVNGSGSLVIQADEDGICADNTGNIAISGGALTVTSTDGYGIRANHDITINGSAEVAVTTTWASGNGIFAESSMTISGKAQVTVTAAVGGLMANGGDVTISGGTVNLAPGAGGPGILGNNVTISGSTVTINAGESMGIMAQGDVAINSGAVHIAAASAGILAGRDIAINGGSGTIQASVPDCPAVASIGLLIPGNNIAVSGWDGAAYTKASQIGSYPFMGAPFNTFVDAANTDAALSNIQFGKQLLSYSLAARTFNGKPQGVAVTPQNGAGKTKAVYYNHSKTAPTNAGAYKITADLAEGAQYGAMTGLLLGTFTINKADLSKIKVLVADAAWTGKQIRPAKFLYNGASFAVGSNATVKQYGANKNIGLGAMTLAGKGNFTGTQALAFKIVPKGNQISKVAAGTKQMKVTWSKVSKTQKITKYQVRYRVKGTTKWTTKRFGASQSSAVIKGLKKGKQYQVQVQSYKTVAKANYYSAWSAVKTSKTIK